MTTTLGLARTSSIYRPSAAVVDLAALTENFRQLRGYLRSPADFFCPMVKADAYGHGAVPVAKALRAAGAEHLGVALVEEGIELREGGDQGRILVFGHLFDAASFSAVLEHDLTLVTSGWEQLTGLAEAARTQAKPNRRVDLHLEFNTGMNRLGFAVEDAMKLRAWLQREVGLQLSGVCTHLLKSDDLVDGDGESRRQIQRFELALQSFADWKILRHAYSSGAFSAVREQTPSSIGSRPGIALYGGQPFVGANLPITPILSLRTRIAALNHVRAGEAVSYNAIWRAKRDSLIGVLPFGYADGYPRALSNRAHVLCRGQRVPVVGTVCMDYFMIDLTELAKGEKTELKIGDDVVLIGRQAGGEILATELAELSGTISYEILTGLSIRVPRIYVGGP